MRLIVLDTETTGMNKFGVHYEGHRVIEIGAVEIIDRRLTDNQFHVYLNPHRAVDIEAFRVHGIHDKFLKNQPIFSDIVDEFLIFIKESQVIIHNASFDLGFLNQELKIFNKNSKRIEFYCTIVDSLKLARRIFPGQRNSLDALCERYFINHDNRNLHNALIDAQLLAKVFLSMTGGQTNINFVNKINTKVLSNMKNDIKTFSNKSCFNAKKTLKVIRANEKEKLQHEEFLDFMQDLNRCCLWRQCNK